MIDGKTIVLVLPAHNEERGLLAMLPKVPTCIDRVVVVDNLSTDNTLKVARHFGALIRWAILKKGYGYTLKCGFHAVRDDIIVAMDADDTYPLDEVERCVHFLLDNDLDFVSCSRFPLKDKNSMKPLNHVGNRFLTMVANELFGLGLHDITSGMWVFRRWLTPHIIWLSSNMTFTIDIKLMANCISAIDFGETYISYRPRIGEVKQKWLRDGFKYLWTLIKMRCER